jgi:hypothetical protein
MPSVAQTNWGHLHHEKLEMPPRLHVLQSRRPQPFPRSAMVAAPCLCKTVMSGCEGRLCSQVRQRCSCGAYNPVYCLEQTE